MRKAVCTLTLHIKKDARWEWVNPRHMALSSQVAHLRGFRDTFLMTKGTRFGQVPLQGECRRRFSRRDRQVPAADARGMLVRM